MVVWHLIHKMPILMQMTESCFVCLYERGAVTGLCTDMAIFCVFLTQTSWRGVQFMWVCKLCIHRDPEKLFVAIKSQGWTTRQESGSGELVWMCACTHTHALAQRAYEPFTWRCTGGNCMDCCCIRRFYDVNVCVHKAAALQFLPLAAAEHKNALLVNLMAKSLLNSFYCLLSTNTLDTISSAHTLQVPFDCELRWSFQTTAMPGTKESY